MHTTLYSHSGQGICAGLSRGGTVPSRVPVSMKRPGYVACGMFSLEAVFARHGAPPPRNAPAANTERERPRPSHGRSRRSHGT
eukprot:5055761-Prymnesium_polylepis.1